MSSGIQKIKTRIELKQENEWLKRAFRNAVSAFTEQQQNGADLAKALWCAAQANGGTLRIRDEVVVTMPKSAKLQSYHDEGTLEHVFVAVVDEPETPQAPDTPPSDVPPLDPLAATEDGECRNFNALREEMSPERRARNAAATEEMLRAPGALYIGGTSDESELGYGHDLGAYAEIAFAANAQRQPEFSA